jgi:alpha-galactosidase
MAYADIGIAEDMLDQHRDKGVPAATYGPSNFNHPATVGPESCIVSVGKLGGEKMGTTKRRFVKAESRAKNATSYVLLIVIAYSARGFASPAGPERPLSQLPSVIAKAMETPPFSFTYGGKPSCELLPHWEQRRLTQTLPGGRERRVLTYRDRHTGLEIVDEVTLYKDFPAVDWVLRLRNTGSVDTSILEALLPLDLRIVAPGAGNIVLHHALGSAKRIANSAGEWGSRFVRDYSPLEKNLNPSDDYSFVHYVMNSRTHVESYLPFFDLQWQTGGLIGGVGWSGEWIIRAQRDDARGLTLQSGQQTIHLKLHPGESIRTPRIVLLQWAGQDRIQGHNLWRRLLIAHYLPRIDGQVATPPVAHTSAYVLIFDAVAKKTGKNPLDVLPTLREADLKDANGLPTTTEALNYVTEANQLELIRGMPPVGIEAYWMDAGWFQDLWPKGRGSWTPRHEFPRGLKPIGDAAHQKGLKFLLWFDPEGVAPGSRIAKEHPEWVLHQPEEGPWGGIFRFSDPVALKWMTNWLSNCIQDWGIDIFRNDRNTCALPFWQAADIPDRQGITEIHQIEGLYAFWDALLERFPNLMIDNGNWRGTGPDLEAMKRTVGCLTRSEADEACLPSAAIIEQAQTAELSLWVPLDASLLGALDPYTFRSTATTGVALGLDLQSAYIPVDQLKKAIAELKSLRPYWLGDYYPLTEVNQDARSWCAWQFDRPDLKAGFATFFRRPESEQSVFAIALRGVDPKADYEMTFAETYDVKEKRVMTGAELGKLQVEIGTAPGVMLVRYRKINGR